MYAEVEIQHSFNILDLYTLYWIHGHINLNECHYCLDCQMTYHNDDKCPPLVNKKKRRNKGKPTAPGPQLIPAVQIVDP